MNISSSSTSTPVMPMPIKGNTIPLAATTSIEAIDKKKQGLRSSVADDPWNRACRLSLVRIDSFGAENTLEPGVNFFILALEQLGAKTLWSCEGHPHDFYIAFNASYELAIALNSWGFFTVEVEGDHKWSLRFNVGMEKRHPTHAKLHQALIWASESWVRGMETLGKPFVFSE